MKQKLSKNQLVIRNSHLGILPYVEKYNINRVEIPSLKSVEDDTGDNSSALPRYRYILKLWKSAAFENLGRLEGADDLAAAFRGFEASP